jgi:hypothetical protein
LNSTTFSSILDLLCLCPPMFLPFLCYYLVSSGSIKIFPDSAMLNWVLILSLSPYFSVF